VNDAVRFLTGFAQAIATMSLYGEGHPARERAVDTAYSALADLQGRAPRQIFTFLGEEVVHGSEPLRELRSWEWSQRLVAAGVQRLELDEAVTRDELEALLEEILARLTLTSIDSPEMRQMRRSRIRFGAVGVRGSEDDAEIPTAVLDYSLSNEADAMRWMQDEVARDRPVPLAEAEAVVSSLSVAMHGDSQMVLPLLRLRNHDEYTTAHSMNVSVLTMAMAEFLGYGGSDIRAFGVAGLLHDLGKVKIPQDILNKPGKLSQEERDIINRHPIDGAKLILESERSLDMAAVVAYEHHLMHDGGGYPDLHYCRTCHSASRLAHVCDVYDALRTNRPYRAAWSSERVLDYIAERAGTEFDPEVANSFVRMMKQWEHRFATLESDRDAVPPPGAQRDLAPEPTPAPEPLPVLDIPLLDGEAMIDLPRAPS
jgi:putative nucleotidyltransferase with HDIG domain